MTSIKSCYVELLHLTQLFLLRKYSLKDVKRVSPTLFAFFQEKMKFSPPLPLAKKILPLPPVPLALTQNPKTPIRSHTSSLSPDPRPESPPREPLRPPAQPEILPPAPQPAKIEKPLSENQGFILEPLTATMPSYDHCQKLFSEWPLCEAIPSDVIAQKNKNAWLNNSIIPPVIILAFHEEEKQLIFLKNIAQAISLRLALAKVLSASKLEKDNCWESVLDSSHLRLVHC